MISNVRKTDLRRDRDDVEQEAYDPYTLDSSVPIDDTPKTIEMVDLRLVVYTDGACSNHGRVHKLKYLHTRVRLDSRKHEH